jgi:hypothetical protein
MGCRRHDLAAGDQIDLQVIACQLAAAEVEEVVAAAEAAAAEEAAVQVALASSRAAAKPRARFDIGDSSPDGSSGKPTTTALMPSATTRSTRMTMA